jgi:para-aminobenzoate synthetase/4-amino-4-deoxychorismate lyase
VVFVRRDGLLTEGSITAIFVERDGKLLTPRLETGLLPSILRRELLEAGKAEEADLRIEDLSDGFWVGNSVRGLIRARPCP